MARNIPNNLTESVVNDIIGTGNTEMINEIFNAGPSNDRRGEDINAYSMTLSSACRKGQDMGFSKEIMDKAINSLLDRGKTVTHDAIFDELYLKQIDSEAANAMRHRTEQHKLRPAHRVEKVPVVKTKLPRLQKAEETAEDETLCKVCLTNKLDTLLRPCKHIASCQSCSKKLKTCPICRATISKKEKVFLS